MEQQEYHFLEFDQQGPELPQCEFCNKLFNPWDNDNENGEYHERVEPKGYERTLGCRRIMSVRPYQFCSQECEDEAFEDTIVGLKEAAYYGADIDFADPGGRSCLRAETPDNPRNLPCPECGAENVLTPADVSLGYCCDTCADRHEGILPS